MQTLHPSSKLYLEVLQHSACAGRLNCLAPIFIIYV